MAHRVFAVAGIVLLCAVGTVSSAATLPDSAGVTTRASQKSGGAQADARGPASAGEPAVSENGFVVAFVSDATNLVADDTNGVSDVFVNQGGAIKRVSLGASFAEANGPSSTPTLSGDGRFVAFTSAADNLVPGDSNTALDVFVYDRQLSTVTRVSVAGDGTQGNGDSRSPSIDRTDGGIFAYGSAVFAGSTGALKLAKPIVALAAAPTGGVLAGGIRRRHLRLRRRRLLRLGRGHEAGPAGGGHGHPVVGGVRVMPQPC